MKKTSQRIVLGAVLAGAALGINGCLKSQAPSPALMEEKIESRQSTAYVLDDVILDDVINEFGDVNLEELNESIFNHETYICVSDSLHFSSGLFACCVFMPEEGTGYFIEYNKNGNLVMEYYSDDCSKNLPKYCLTSFPGSINFGNQNNAIVIEDMNGVWQQSNYQVKGNECKLVSESFVPIEQIVYFKARIDSLVEKLGLSTPFSQD